MYIGTKANLRSIHKTAHLGKFRVRYGGGEDYSGHWITAVEVEAPTSRLRFIDIATKSAHTAQPEGIAEDESKDGE